jgi:hypothetical protein
MSIKPKVLMREDEFVLVMAHTKIKRFRKPLAPNETPGGNPAFGRHPVVRHENRPTSYQCKMIFPTAFREARNSIASATCSMG